MLVAPVVKAIVLIELIALSWAHFHKQLAQGKAVCMAVLRGLLKTKFGISWFIIPVVQNDMRATAGAMTSINDLREWNAFSPRCDSHV